MKDFLCKVEIRWSDLDPNFHLRHSAYYDFGAYSRIKFLTEYGITPEIMLEHNIGPIIFREECIFKKEIKFGDDISINLRLETVNADFSKWTMKHEIFKNDNILAAIITVDAAWMDTLKRRLTIPPEFFKESFRAIPKTESFKSYSDN